MSSRLNTIIVFNLLVVPKIYCSIYFALSFQKQLLYMKNLLSPIIVKFDSVVTKVIVRGYSCVLIIPSYPDVLFIIPKIKKKVNLLVGLDELHVPLIFISAHVRS